MKSYTVHEPPEPSTDTLNKADRIEFVYVGFSWIALILPVVWLAYYRMWIVLAVYIGLLGGLQGLAYALGSADTLSDLLTFAAELIFAYEANNLRRWTLERAGYELVGTVTGNTPEECELKFFSNWIDEERSAADLTAIAAKAVAGRNPALAGPPVY